MALEALELGLSHEQHRLYGNEGRASLGMNEHAVSIRNQDFIFPDSPTLFTPVVLEDQDQVLVRRSWDVVRQFESDRGVYEITAGDKRYVLKLERTTLFREIPVSAKDEYETARELYARSISAGGVRATWERPIGIVTVTKDTKGVLFEFIDGFQGHNNGENEETTLRRIYESLKKRPSEDDTDTETLRTKALFLRMAAEYLHRLTRQNSYSEDHGLMFDVRYQTHVDGPEALTITGFDVEHMTVWPKTPLNTDVYERHLLEKPRKDLFLSAFEYEMSSEQVALYVSYGQELVASLQHKN